MYSRSWLLFVLLVGFVAMPSSGDTIYATGSGWCDSGGSCNNTNTSVINNHFAGLSGNGYNNWLAFDIPNLGTITSATLSIWNDAQNYTTNPAATYNVYEGDVLTYAGIMTGQIFGSQNVGLADTGVGHYVDIVLNNDALGILNGAQGTNFWFGGSVVANPGDHVEIFGYTGGTPLAMLTLNETSEIPEPGTFAAVALGLATAAVLRRRRASH
jgi:hypothetical protein